MLVGWTERMKHDGYVLALYNLKFGRYPGVTDPVGCDVLNHRLSRSASSYGPTFDRRLNGHDDERDPPENEILSDTRNACSIFS